MEEIFQLGGPDRERVAKRKVVALQAGQGKAGAKADDWTPPDWLNLSAWRDFEQHRREIRKPLTPLARAKAVNQLRGLTAREQQQVVDESIQAGWTGLFPERLRRAKGGGAGGQWADDCFPVLEV